MVTVYTHGLMVDSTKATMSMIRSMVRECILNQMEQHMMEAGRMVSSTAKVFLRTDLAKREKDNGKMEQELRGLTKTLLIINQRCILKTSFMEKVANRVTLNHNRGLDDENLRQIIIIFCKTIIYKFYF